MEFKNLPFQNLRAKFNQTWHKTALDEGYWHWRIQEFLNKGRGVIFLGLEIHTYPMFF